MAQYQRIFYVNIVVAIILAAGAGTRFGSDKSSYRIGEREVIEYSIERLQQSASIDQIILVSTKERHVADQKKMQKYTKITDVVIGGKTRFESSTIGFRAAVAIGASLVVFHNGCNPGVTDAEITTVIAAAKTDGAAGVARPITATLRHKTGGTIDRSGLFAMETPQAMRSTIFEKGLQNISENPTDDLQLAEAAGVIPKIVAASATNFKLTTRADLFFLEYMLSQQNEIRVGLGQDSHRFDTSGNLVLGGVTITSAPKLQGNSDGDAVLHALTNALSSALGGGSLGTFADKMYTGGITDSSQYLAEIMKALYEKEGKITNLSVSIEASKPKLEAFFSQMKEHIAAVCEINSHQIGITVTSGEGLTAVGKGEGIAVFALVTVSLPKVTV